MQKIQLKIMNIKNYYLETYPTDTLGLQINEDATFAGLLNTLIKGVLVYKYVGVYDSVIRERLFKKLAKDMQLDYGDVYLLWLTMNKD